MKEKIYLKKSQSQVISTILLILLSITAVSIIAGVIIPMVRDYASDRCFETIGVLEIDRSSEYTCYDKNNEKGEGKTFVAVKRASKNVEIEGFALSVSGETDSKVFSIKEGEEIDEVKMFDGNTLKIPERGGMKTYVIDVEFEVKGVKIAPISNGKLCENYEEVNLEIC